jgi:hypothetical protein
MEEHRLKVFENNEVREIYKPARDKERERERKEKST